MTQTEMKAIGELLRREVVPAVGCTEPASVSLCVAKAVEVLGYMPDSLEVYMSPNVVKNALGVGIPGTDMTGLPIAVALGAVCGKSVYLLEVLKDCTPEYVSAARRLIDAGRIKLSIKDGIDCKLYIETICKSGKDISRVVISGEHTKFTCVERNGDVLLTEEDISCEDSVVDEPVLDFRKLYDYSTETPLEDLSFLLKGAMVNESAAEEALEDDYGHTLGKTLQKERWRAIVGDSILTDVIAYTSAACDARMGGAMVPVITNSGSGNQGITATLPVFIYGKANNCEQEKIVRALALSNLTVIYIKQNLGRLSALCGCVVAATGSSCGITYLMGGTYEQITFSVKNMIANLTGMICDGAKPSCSLKISSAASTAVLSAILAMEDKCVSSLEGIIDDDVDKSIRNLTVIGSEGMLRTDEMILDIMMNKSTE